MKKVKYKRVIYVSFPSSFDIELTQQSDGSFSKPEEKEYLKPELISVDLATGKDATNIRDYARNHDDTMDETVFTLRPQFTKAKKILTREQEHYILYGRRILKKC